jgi:hypothetical protein
MTLIRLKLAGIITTDRGTAWNGHFIRVLVFYRERSLWNTQFTDFVRFLT